MMLRYGALTDEAMEFTPARSPATTQPKQKVNA